MNTHRYLGSNLFCFLAALLLVGAGCRTVQENNVSLDSKVVRFKGVARSSSDGKTWRPIRMGDVLAPGSIVQISKDEKSFVDIVLGETSRPQPVIEAHYEVNIVRLFGSSVLRIDKVATKNNCYGPLVVKLDLLAGKMMGEAHPPAPSFKYALGFTNGIAHTKGNTWYQITADGELAVFAGVITLTLNGSNLVTEVVAPHKFDPNTGLLTEVRVPYRPCVRTLPPPREWPPWQRRRF